LQAKKVDYISASAKIMQKLDDIEKRVEKVDRTVNTLEFFHYAVRNGLREGSRETDSVRTPLRIHVREFLRQFNAFLLP
jgi:hypothetical protein